MRRSPSSTGEYRGSFEHRHGLLNMTTCRDLQDPLDRPTTGMAGFVNRMRAYIFLTIGMHVHSRVGGSAKVNMDATKSPCLRAGRPKE